MAGADLVLLHQLASSPHLIHLALHVVDVLGTPRPSEEQEDEKEEEGNTEAARQGIVSSPNPLALESEAKNLSSDSYNDDLSDGGGDDIILVILTAISYTHERHP